MTDIFQRSIHSNVKKTEDGRLLVTSSLLDLEHSFHMEMEVRMGDGLILAAKGSMSMAPFEKCRQGTAGLGDLVGLRVGRGIVREVNRRLGGGCGCAHLVELVTDAVRLVSMIRIGASTGYWSELKQTMSEEEIIAAGRGKLRNTCLVFADDEPVTGSP